MSKATLSKEIEKELAKLNDRIDRKIIKGQSFQTEARRHRELLSTLRRMHTEVPIHTAWRARRIVRSPVRRSLAGGAIERILGVRFA